MSEYFDYDVSKIKAIHPTKLLIDWQKASDTYLGGKIKRPEHWKGVHYTGHIIMIGCDVSILKAKGKIVEVGDRILFEGYMNSGMPKFMDPKLGRCCIIDEDEAIAVCSERVKVSSVEGDFDYSA